MSEIPRQKTFHKKITKLGSNLMVIIPRNIEREMSLKHKEQIAITLIRKAREV